MCKNQIGYDIFFYISSISLYLFKNVQYKLMKHINQTSIDPKYSSQQHQQGSGSPQSQQQESDQPQNPHLPQNSTLQVYQLCIQEVASALHTIDKIKKISKNDKTNLKKKHKQFNRLFASMSDLFVSKKKIGIIAKKILTQKRKQQRRNTTLCKKSEGFSKILTQLINSNKDNKDQDHPQILQQIPSQPQLLQQVDISFLSKFTVKPLVCYVCLQDYQQIDDIYHKHCVSCAQFDKSKRFQSADLRGFTALVTGGRIKIGYEITLKLLRDGATVYTTTRFIADALKRYQKEPDYQNWKTNIFLIQCDFMSSDQVTSLINYIKLHVPHLDILIHNAAQTIVRPPEFFTSELLSNQQLAQLPPSQNFIKFNNTSTPSLQLLPRPKCITGEPIVDIDLSKKDQFGQPIDLRQKNTWKQKIQDVSLFDCMSTQVVNSTVPFFITGQLRCIMGGQKPSWVINVSSMEGVFYRSFKSCYHPHTNMAKASLNMMTRTCSGQLSKNNIYMSSVDTGWVTNQNPVHIAAKMNVIHDFTPPLDCIDGAMRVLDPIYQGVKQRKFIYGKFLKNYKESVW